MSAVGQRISLGLVALVVLTVAGAAGTTVFYQDSAEQLRDQNDALRSENAELSEQLNETRTQLEATRERLNETRSRLNTRTQDVDQVARSG